MILRLTEALESHKFAYLTTTGRVSGRPHRIEIWFVVIDGTVWLASGGRDRADWVQNLLAESLVILEIGDHRWSGTATTRPEMATHAARQRLAQRYQGWEPAQPLSEWAQQSLLVEVVVDNER